MTTQDEMLAALRALLDSRSEPIPDREADPVGYIIAESNRAEREGREMTPADKDLAYKLFTWPLTNGLVATADADE